LPQPQTTKLRRRVPSDHLDHLVQPSPREPRLTSPSLQKHSMRKGVPVRPPSAPAPPSRPKPDAGAARPEGFAANGAEIITRSLLHRPRERGTCFGATRPAPRGAGREAARATAGGECFCVHSGAPRTFDESVISQVGVCGSGREHRSGRLLYRYDSMA